jgi:hypothetical protein
VWHSLLNILGFSSLIAAILTHILSTRQQRRNWINDNKKLEWRQLIDELRTARALVAKAFLAEGLIEDRSENNKLVAQGVVRGSEVINDRIFIAETVETNRINDKWNALVAITNRENDSSAVIKFLDFYGELHSELVKLARQDLMNIRWWKLLEWF